MTIPETDLIKTVSIDDVPANPQLGRKAAITTAISLAIWGVYFYVTQILGFSLLALTQAGR